MKVVGVLNIIALVFLVLFAGPVAAQEPPEVHPPAVLRFDITLETTEPIVEVNQFTTIQYTIVDRSRDDPGELAGQGSAAPIFPHTVAISTTPLGDSEGWQIQHPQGTQMRTGQEVTGNLRISALPSAASPRLLMTMTFMASHPQSDEVAYYNFTINAYSPGLESFAALSAGGYNDQVGPRAIVNAPVRILNQGFVDRSFSMEITSNPCGVDVGLPSGMVVGPRTSDLFEVSIVAPSDKFLYLSQDCTVTVEVWPDDNPDRRMQVSLAMVVNGSYVEPTYIFWALAAALAVFFLVLLILRRKAAIEEEILGKPQKPWTIPVEEVYLRHLKQRDPRAHYVVRNFLMEEEYRSALLWYRDYKSATRGSRAKEAMIVRQEHKIQQARKKHQKAIAAPIKRAERHEAALQRSLDKQSRAAQKKHNRRADKIAKKMRKAYEAKLARETSKWEKAAKKAQKKGNPTPPRPDVETPDYPAKVEAQKVLLADHKLNQKALKFRKKMARKQGDLEVKFERKEARLLRKVRRKVDKVARKLDDPDFVAEHPLLQGS